MKTLTHLTLVVAGLLAYCFTTFAQYIYIPTNVAGVNMSYVVPDMALWYNGTDGYYTNGFVDTAKQTINLSNWEPYASVLGYSTFLIEANTYADNGTLADQRFVVALQPAAGGAPKIGEGFFDDNGAPFRDACNLRRQNGNPGRVAGDKRAGAVNFIVSAETGLGNSGFFPTFHTSPDRWTNNPTYQDYLSTYVTAQPYSLNTSTLAQTPTALAWDYIYGPLVTNAFPLAAGEISRTGGGLAALDDGNFVVMSDDKTGYLGPSRCTTFTIITPTGSFVKNATLVHSADIWDNVCAYKGGFAVRAHQMLYFFDNSGNFKFGQTADNGLDIQASSGLALDTGRGDGHRIASDIRSHYVYFGGKVGNQVMLAIWDANTGTIVSTNEVSDTDPVFAVPDRVNLAVDENDRFCVAYGMKVDPVVWPGLQVIARVGKFNGASVCWLTPSFYAFTNHESDPNNVLGYVTQRPAVAMTPDYICIAGKGLFNSVNNPTLPPDTGGGFDTETTLYTVLSGPVLPQTPTIAATPSGANLVLSWTWAGPPCVYNLQKSPTAQPATWSLVGNVVQVGNNYYSTNAVGAGSEFFRLSSKPL